MSNSGCWFVEVAKVDACPGNGMDIHCRKWVAVFFFLFLYCFHFFFCLFSLSYSFSYIHFSLFLFISLPQTSFSVSLLIHRICCIICWMLSMTLSPFWLITQKYSPFWREWFRAIRIYVSSNQILSGKCFTSKHNYCWLFLSLFYIACGNYILSAS